MKKYYLNGFEVKPHLAKYLERSKYFELINFREDLLCNKFYHYEFKGYKQPLLCFVSDDFSLVHSPYEYSGSYTYNGERTISLHSTYGRFETYRIIQIFGVPFMVNTLLSDEDAILAAETDDHFISSLIKAL